MRAASRTVRLTVALLAVNPILASAQAGEPASPAVVRVELARESAELTGEAVRGRLLVFLAYQKPAVPGAPLRLQDDPEAVWVAATDVGMLRPGESVDVNVDSLAFPRPLSAAREGPKYLMALIDVNDDFGYFGFREGDVLSEVTEVERVGTRTGPTRLLINRRVPAREIRDTAGIQLVTLRSDLVSAYLGAPAQLRATVVLPTDYPAGGRRYRAVYHIPGWGGDHLVGYLRGRREMDEMRSGGERDAIHVYLDPSFRHGHHAFANSDTDGPWGDALVRELVPALERRFGIEPSAQNRQLLGHSSGGWSALWLQIAYPDFFGGAWATAPDPVDFEQFYAGVSVAPGSRDNVFQAPDGAPVKLVRTAQPERGSLRDAVRLEDVVSPGRGAVGSFAAVFGPRGADGEPVPLFDHLTGAQNPAVQAAWARFDIDRVLAERWDSIGARLKGKLHLRVGAEDNFFLDQPARSLCRSLAALDPTATCEIVPARNHFDLYRPAEGSAEGLLGRIGREMQALHDESP